MFIGIKGLGVVGSVVGNVSGPAYDSDAQTYIDAVEAADGQALETDVKEAYNNFFVGLKDDGLLNDLSACCLLLGARTVAGALTPLVPSMPTPTNNNFVSGDYSRTTGLKGDASTKYIDTGLAANSDGQNDFHLSVYETELHNTGGSTGGIIGYTDFPGSGNAAQIVYRYNALFIQRAKDPNSTQLSRGTTTGFSGIVRNGPFVLITATPVAPETLQVQVVLRQAPICMFLRTTCQEQAHILKRTAESPFIHSVRQ